MISSDSSFQVPEGLLGLAVVSLGMCSAVSAAALGPELQFVRSLQTAHPSVPLPCSLSGWKPVLPEYLRSHLETKPLDVPQLLSLSGRACAGWELPERWLWYLDSLISVLRLGSFTWQMFCLLLCSHWRLHCSCLYRGRGPFCRAFQEHGTDSSSPC